jgi:ribonucleoside-diphosphate reductase alpha chain
MIDTREEVGSSPKLEMRSRSASLSASRAPARPLARSRKQLGIERVFSDADVQPFDQIEWDKRTAEITDDAGKVIFKQENVEVPKSWSVLATKVVVSKYFYEQNQKKIRLPSK